MNAEQQKEFEFHRERMNREWEAGCAVNDRLKQMMQARNNAPLSQMEIEEMMVWHEKAFTAALANESPIPMPSIKRPKKFFFRVWNITVVWFDYWSNKFGLAIEWGDYKTLFKIGF